MKTLRCIAVPIYVGLSRLGRGVTCAVVPGLQIPAAASLIGAYELIEPITGRNAKMFTMQVPITIELADVAPYRSVGTGQPHLGQCFREALNYLRQHPDVILVHALMIGPVVRRWLGLPWRRGFSTRRAAPPFQR